MPKSPKPGEKAGELARSIWLAGLGAYGKAWDQAQDRYQKAEKDTAKLFEDLVDKGQKIEQETQKKVQEVADLSQSFSIEDRIQKVRESFGFVSPSTDTKVVDTLTDEVASLKEQVESLEKEIRKMQKSRSK